LSNRQFDLTFDCASVMSHGLCRGVITVRQFMSEVQNSRSVHKYVHFLGLNGNTAHIPRPRKMKS